MKLSKYFDSSEFVCRDGSSTNMSPALIMKLTSLREKVGKPVNVNSGYRSPKYNKTIGGATHSYHMKGMAADIHVDGWTSHDLGILAERLGFTGIGLYDTFVHVDVRPTKARWDFRTKKDKEGNAVVKKNIGVIIDGKNLGRIGVLIDGMTYIPIRTVKDDLNIKDARWEEVTETAVIETGGK